VRNEAVKAQYEHGILELRLTRAEPGNSQAGVALLRVNPSQ
jgi:HSP20 family molecular chaperone IbpA